MMASSAYRLVGGRAAGTCAPGPGRHLLLRFLLLLPACTARADSSHNTTVAAAPVGGTSATEHFLAPPPELKVQASAGASNPSTPSADARAPHASMTTAPDATAAEATEPSATAPNAAAPNATAPNLTAASTLPAALLPSPRPWITGTWTTGYWDCCKPSCSWPGKGNVNRPALSCDIETGEAMPDANERSVCDGGRAASCLQHQPFLVHRRVGMGFAAAAVSGHHGLTGDTNCGQCYELRFVDQRHDAGAWGGAARGLVNKTMIVQVTNIGYDVTGDHSFDLQIPGAGRGIFDGCAAQFRGSRAGDFDCDNRYGGCRSRDGCSRLPLELRAGCYWRYDWLLWQQAGGQTNNPFVKFRRVRCPQALTNLSGFAALDDELLQDVNLADYV